MLTLIRHRRKSYRVSYTLEESFADNSANEYEWSKASSSAYVGTLVSPSSSYMATRLEFHLKKTGTGGGTITAEIWSATGSSGSETPDSLLSSSSTTVAAAGVSAAGGFVSFDFAGQALAAGTKYFFVMKTIEPGDTSNYYDLTLGSSYNTTNFETVRREFSSSQLTYSYWNTGTTSNPTTQSGFEAFFTGTPAGTGTHSTVINWDHNDSRGDKPDYLPANSYAWQVEGYIYAATAGTYYFGTGSDDGNQLTIGGTIVTSFYGGRGVPGTVTSPGDTGSISLTVGYHTFRYRMQEGSGGDGGYVAWKPPGTSSYVVTPVSVYAAQSSWVSVNGDRGGYCRSYSDGGADVTITDDFNRSDTLLESAATAEGWYWVNGKSDPDTMSVSSNKARVTNANDSTEYYADYNLGPNAEVQVTVTNEWPSNTSGSNVSARFTDRDNRYRVHRREDQGDWRLYKVVAGTQTEIGTRYSASTTPPYTLKLVCDGDQISVYIDDVLRIGPVTDTSITTGNYVAIGGYNNGSNRIELDDFVASSLSSGAPSAITFKTSATTSATSYATPINIDVNIPAVSADDILLLFCTTADESQPTDSPPSGWTKIGEQDGSSTSGETVAAYWKRASGSATATTETWSAFYPNGETYYIWVGAYSGCVTSGSPVDTNAGNSINYGSSVASSFTTNVANTMVVSMAGTFNQSATWSPSGEIVDTNYSGSQYASVNGSIESTAGSKTATATLSGNTRSTILTVALRDTAPTPLQTRTVTYDSSDVAVFTIDSDSGQKIWSDQKLDQANVSSGLRLWNGSEAGNSGATADGTKWEFSSGGDCTTWWDNYWMRVKQDPDTGTFSDWINITDADGLMYTSCQPEYNNIGSSQAHHTGPGTWTTHAAGFRYQVEIYSVSNRP